MTHDPADDLVPVSVRLGEVVPPEDPEDWTRPLTWVAAFGMLAGPIVALAWFVVAPPENAAAALPPTYLVATSLAAGAAVTGATQVGAARAFTHVRNASFAIGTAPTARGKGRCAALVRDWHALCCSFHRVCKTPDVNLPVQPAGELR